MVWATIGYSYLRPKWSKKSRISIILKHIYSAHAKCAFVVFILAVLFILLKVLRYFFDGFKIIYTNRIYAHNPSIYLFWLKIYITIKYSMFIK